MKTKNLNKLMLLPLCTFSIMTNGGAKLFAEENKETKTSINKVNKDYKWAHEISDIPVDSNIKFGYLKNGLTYAIIKNAEPKHRASLRMYVSSGSFNENDNQCGLAHFLEHMVFNGSKNHPKGMTEHFQRMGLEFGKDVNAYTSFDSTVYMLETPKSDKDYLSEAFTLFRDYADGALLTAEGIENERGVILSEKRDNSDADRRTRDKMLDLFFPGTIIAKRLPIGTTEVISGAPPKLIRDYYHDYYAANRIMIVACGDFDINEVENIIKDKFSNLHTSKVEDKDLGKITTNKDLQVLIAVEKETKKDTAYLAFSKDKIELLDTRENRINEIIQTMVSGMFNLRMDRITRKSDSPVLSCSLGKISFGPGDTTFANIIPKETNLEESITFLENELRRVEQFGFTDEEIRTVKEKTLSSYERLVEQANTRKSRSIAEKIVRKYQNKKVATSPETNLELAKEAISKLDKKIALDCFKKMLEYKTQSLLISTNQEIGDKGEHFKNVLAESKKINLTAPVELETKTFAYSSNETKGKVATQTTVSDLDIHQIVFENNVVLNIKKTPFEAGVVKTMINVGTGLANMPNKQGLSKLAEEIFITGALGKHKIDDLEQIFSSKNISTSFSIAPSCFTFSGTSTPTDLIFQLEVLKAYIVDPGFCEDAFTQYRNYLDFIYNKANHTPIGFFQNKIAYYISGNDYRWGYPEKQVMQKYTREDVKSWLKPEFDNGYIEIGIVGDVDIEKTIELVARTFGKLNTRPAKNKIEDSKLTINCPWNDGHKDFNYTSAEPRGIAVVMWPIIEDEYSANNARRISILGDILADRITKEIREKEGLAYSPSARGVNFRDYKKYGYFMSFAQVSPQNSTKAINLIKEIGNELAKGNISEDEFKRIHNPYAFSIRDQLQNNDYWLKSVVTPSQSKPVVLEWSRNLLSDAQGITKEEIIALAKKYFSQKPLSISLNPENNNK